MPARIHLILAAGLAILGAAGSPARGQDVAVPPRPHILGLAHVGLYTHDIDRSLQFYHDFLGFDEPFSLSNADGSLQIAWIKINDRQSVELFPEKRANTDRMVEIAFETDDAEAMRLYLKARGTPVPDRTNRDRDGTASFDVTDPDGHQVEFVQFLPDGWAARDRGQHLPDTRISLRMPHAGIMIHNLDASLKFYRDLLGFRETWRGSKNGRVLSWVNLTVPDGRDYVEFMLYDTMPALLRINTMHHFCLEVPNVAQAAAILKARSMPAGSKPATHIAIGVNGKRQINYYDPDGTRVEIMEPGTFNGKPVPPSSAPPPGAGA